MHLSPPTPSGRQHTKASSSHPPLIGPQGLPACTASLLQLAKTRQITVGTEAVKSSLASRSRSVLTSKFWSAPNNRFSVYYTARLPFFRCDTSLYRSMLCREPTYWNRWLCECDEHQTYTQQEISGAVRSTDLECFESRKLLGMVPCNLRQTLVLTWR